MRFCARIIHIFFQCILCGEAGSVPGGEKGQMVQVRAAAAAMAMAAAAAGERRRSLGRGWTWSVLLQVRYSVFFWI